MKRTPIIVRVPIVIRTSIVVRSPIIIRKPIVTSVPIIRRVAIVVRTPIVIRISIVVRTPIIQRTPILIVKEATDDTDDGSPPKKWNKKDDDKKDHRREIGLFDIRDEKLLAIARYYEYKVRKATAVPVCMFPDKPWRNKKKWTILNHLLDTIDSVGAQYQVYIDAQFASVRNWKNRRLVFPYANQMYSDRAIKAYEAYVRDATELATPDRTGEIKINVKHDEVTGLRKTIMHALEKDCEHMASLIVQQVHDNGHNGAYANRPLSFVRMQIMRNIHLSTQFSEFFLASNSEWVDYLNNYDDPAVLSDDAKKLLRRAANVLHSSTQLSIIKEYLDKMEYFFLLPVVWTSQQLEDYKADKWKPDVNSIPAYHQFSDKELERHFRLTDKYDSVNKLSMLSYRYYKQPVYKYSDNAIALEKQRRDRIQQKKEEERKKEQEVAIRAEIAARPQSYYDTKRKLWEQENAEAAKQEDIDITALVDELKPHGCKLVDRYNAGAHQEDFTEEEWYELTKELEDRAKDEIRQMHTGQWQQKRCDETWEQYEQRQTDWEDYQRIVYHGWCQGAPKYDVHWREKRQAEYNRVHGIDPEEDVLRAERHQRALQDITPEVPDMLEEMKSRSVW